jgi:dihydroorotase
MYDLLLKGGTVVDPSVGLHGVHDIAVQDGKIARIAPTIPREEARRVHEVADKIVTPGLIDLHAHVFDGFTGNGVHPDLGGVYAGVTTLVDAGKFRMRHFRGLPAAYYSPVSY